MLLCVLDMIAKITSHKVIKWPIIAELCQKLVFALCLSMVRVAYMQTRTQYLHMIKGVSP
jgi:hypothetical protein